MLQELKERRSHSPCLGRLMWHFQGTRRRSLGRRFVTPPKLQCALSYHISYSVVSVVIGFCLKTNLISSDGPISTVSYYFSANLSTLRAMVAVFGDLNSYWLTFFRKNLVIWQNTLKEQPDLGSTLVCQRDCFSISYNNLNISCVMSG